MCNAFNKKFIDEAAKKYEVQPEVSKPCSDSDYMELAIEEAIKGMEKNEGGPFGCVIIKDGKVLGRGNNRVTSSNDPTAHAEIVAIREACANLNDFQLTGCVLYTSCEPCPMCLGAIYWARPDQVFYGCDKNDAARAGFDDHFIYEQLDLPPEKRKIPFVQLLPEKAIKSFQFWEQKENKIKY
jgi:tRNA(Arg) A34 adenosine deaminase TadA